MKHTFTQSDVEKLLIEYLAKKNLKIVGKFLSDLRDNTVSVDVEEIEPKVVEGKTYSVDVLELFDELQKKSKIEFAKNQTIVPWND